MANQDHNELTPHQHASRCTLILLWPCKWDYDYRNPFFHLAQLRNPSTGRFTAALETGQIVSAPHAEPLEVFPPGSLPSINPLEHGLFHEEVQRVAGEGNCMYE